MSQRGGGGGVGRVGLPRLCGSGAGGPTSSSGSSNPPAAKSAGLFGMFRRKGAQKGGITSLPRIPSAEASAKARGPSNTSESELCLRIMLTTGALVPFFNAVACCLHPRASSLACRPLPTRIIRVFEWNYSHLCTLTSRRAASCRANTKRLPSPSPRGLRC